MKGKKSKTLSNFNVADVTSLNKIGGVGTTDAQIPDPTPLPVPHAWMVIVRPVPIRKASKGGILFSDNFVKDQQNLTTVGRVLIMGADAFKVGQASKSYDVGDYVVWSRMRGERFVYKGVSLVILADDDILMKVRAPEDLDPMKELE